MSQIEISEDLFIALAELKDFLIDDDREELSDELAKFSSHCTTKDVNQHEIGMTKKITVSERLYLELNDYVDILEERYGPDISKELKDIINNTEMKSIKDVSQQGAN